ncbi:hypothetical protein FTO60_00355 [Octadecabacter sp. SW4]|nr:hypothetical protein FTO60_00355 [Octadecabacter sp. SW4]
MVGTLIFWSNPEVVIFFSNLFSFRKHYCQEFSNNDTASDVTVNNFDPTEDQLAVVIPKAATLSAADQATLDAQDNVFDIAATQDGADTLITLTPPLAGSSRHNRSSSGTRQQRISIPTIPPCCWNTAPKSRHHCSTSALFLGSLA